MHRFLATIRLHDWWYAKIPPLIGIGCAVFLLGSGEIPILKDVGTVWILIFSICCVAAYGHAINDTFDIHLDEAAGRKNTMMGFSPIVRALICVVFLLAGFAPFLLGRLPWSGSVYLAGNYLMPTLYSIRFVRLKERGLWGIVSDMAGSHLFPTLLILATFASTYGWGPFSTVAVVWAVIFGVKGIVYHQIGHYFDDIKSGTKTWIAAGRLDRWMRVLPYYNLGLELPVNLLLVLMLWRVAPLATWALTAYLAVEFTKCLLGFRFAHNAEKEAHRRSVPFANSFFYEIWFPLALGLAVAIAEPRAWWVPALLPVLFFPVYAMQLRDLRDVGRALRGRLFPRSFAG